MCSTSNQPKDDSCIFCKIIAGGIPCSKLYEDAQVLCFLDVNPLSDGHALVIPKGHWATIDKVPEDVSAAIGACLPKLSKAIKGATGTSDWNILQNNGRAAHQEVDHVHFHIIPKNSAGGLGIDWPTKGLDKEKGEELCKIVRELIENGELII